MTRRKPVKLPGTNKSEPTTVYVGPYTDHGYEESADVYSDAQGGVFLGTLIKGEYTYSPKAAGFGGRIARYHKSVSEWQAQAANSTQHRKYRGGNYPGRNTRQCALIYLVLSMNLVEHPHYFYVERNR